MNHNIIPKFKVFSMPEISIILYINFQFYLKRTFYWRKISSRNVLKTSIFGISPEIWVPKFKIFSMPEISIL